MIKLTFGLNIMKKIIPFKENILQQTRKYCIGFVLRFMYIR